MRRLTLPLIIALAAVLGGGAALATHFDNNASTGTFDPQMAVTVTQASTPMLVNRPTSFTLSLTQADHEDPPVFLWLRSPGDWQFAFDTTKPAETTGGLPTDDCEDAIDNHGNSSPSDAELVRAEKIGTTHLEVHADGITRPGAPAEWDGDIGFVSYDSVAKEAIICLLLITTDTRVTSIPDSEGVTELIFDVPVRLVTIGSDTWWEVEGDLESVVQESELQTLNVSVLDLTSNFFGTTLGNWHPGGIAFSRAPNVSGSHSFQGQFRTCPPDDPAYGNCKSNKPDVTRTSSFTFALPAPVITSPASGTLHNTFPTTISGTVDPIVVGHEVRIFEDATPLPGVGVIDGSGNWSVDAEIPDGNQTLTARVVDAGGQSPASNSITITIDTIPPAAPVINVPAESALVGGTNVTISGTGEAGATLELFEGVVPLGTLTVPGSGNWTTTKSMTKGPHTIRARATDPATNVGPFSLDRSFNVTTAPPLIAAPTEGSFTNDVSVTVSGLAEDGALVDVRQGGISIGTTIATGGVWSLTHAFPEGTQVIDATATAGGFLSPPSPLRTFTVDLTPPDAPAITSPVPGQVVGSISVPVTGTAEAFASVAVFEGGRRLGTGVAGPAGNWATTVVLEDGSHTIFAVATDRAGNAGPASPTVTFTVDDPLEIITPASGAFTQGTVEVTGTADPSATQVRIFEGLIELGRTGVTDGDWSITLSFPSGTHTIHARALSGGVLGPNSPANTFRVDADPPTAKVKRPQYYTFFGWHIGEPVTVYASDSRPTDSGLDRVEVTFTNLLTGEETTVLASCFADCDDPTKTSRWTAEEPLPGFYDVTTTVYDNVGNTASDTLLLVLLF